MEPSFSLSFFAKSFRTTVTCLLWTKKTPCTHRPQSVVCGISGWLGHILFFGSVLSFCYAQWEAAWLGGEEWSPYMNERIKKRGPAKRCFDFVRHVDLFVVWTATLIPAKFQLINCNNLQYIRSTSNSLMWSIQSMKRVYKQKQKSILSFMDENRPKESSQI